MIEEAYAVTTEELLQTCATDPSHINNINYIRNALGKYAVDHKYYPTKLEELVPLYMSIVPRYSTSSPYYYAYYPAFNPTSYHIGSPLGGCSIEGQSALSTDTDFNSVERNYIGGFDGKDPVFDLIGGNIPIITSISPSSTGAGSFDLTINGNKFDSGAVDQVYTPDSTYMGQGAIKSRTATQIVVMEYMNGTGPGNYTVYVKNSDGQLSNGVTLTITNTAVVPTDKFLTYLNPDPYGDPSRAYWIQNNKRYYVIDSNIIDTMRSYSIPGWSWQGIYTVSDVYTPGLDFISTANTSNELYIRLYGGTDIYKINNGIKEYVSYTACQQANCWSDVIDVPQTYLDVFGPQVGISQLPQTGQTTCYNNSGTVIPCAGTGQDGEIKAGVQWPSPRFTDHSITDPTQPVVTDNLTSLMWTKNANLPGAARTWQQALDYVKGMNTGIYPNFGYTDWRLPNINELESLIDAAKQGPALPSEHPFTNVVSSSYWSGTSFYNYAWIVHLLAGNVSWDVKIPSYSVYVWPVRSRQFGTISLPQTGQTACHDTAGTVIPCAGTGQDGEIRSGVPWPSPRFTDHSITDPTQPVVTDNLTSLMWTKNANLPGADRTWQQALDYVKGMNTGIYPNFGYTDWRLPNRKELHSLTEFSENYPALPLLHPYLNVQSIYWSSTTDVVPYYTFYAWYIAMYSGGMYLNPKYYTGYVWPVRGGQIAPSISGKVTANGVGLSGVTISLSGTSSATITTTSDGTYSLSNLTDGSYTITPSINGYIFTPTSRSVTVVGVNVTGIDFTANLANRPPTLDPIGPMSINEGSSLTFTISGSDPDGNSLTYSTSTLPAGATFDPVTRTFSYTPDYTQAGLYSGTFTVSDGRLTASETVVITVNNVPAPIMDSDGDGIPNDFELYNGLDPYNAADASQDLDGDSLTNLYEYLSGTNPIMPDTDGDGMNDGAEVRLGTNPLSQNNIPPVANFEFNPNIADSVEDVVLDATSSFDPDGQIILYMWDLDGDGIIDQYTGSPILTYWWPTSGTYKVLLRVVDDEGGSSSITKEITIQETKTYQIALVAWSFRGFLDWFNQLLQRDSPDINIIDHWMRELQPELKELEWLDWGSIKDDKVRVLTEALSQEINQSEIPGLTYKQWILNSIREESFVHESVGKFPPDYLSFGLPLFEYAFGTVKGSMIDTGIDTIEQIADSTKLTIGLETILFVKKILDLKKTFDAIDDLLFESALGKYFFMRYIGTTEIGAWDEVEWAVRASNSMTDPQELDTMLAETRVYFDHLWITYAEYGQSQIGLIDAFRKMKREEVKFLIVEAIKKSGYKLPPKQEIRLASPVELRVYDFEGRVTGVINGAIIEKIPYSAYDADVETAVIYFPDSSHEYELVGTSEGIYGLTIKNFENGESITFSATDIPTSLNEAHKYIINWNTFVSGQGVVTVEVDLNRDNIFERSFVTNNILTADEFILQTSDSVPPTITAFLAMLPNSLGWHNSDITVTFTCFDNLSGVAICSAPVTVSTEDADQVINGTAVDAAGNTASTSVTINIDKTPPIITASLSTPPNFFGWHDGDVTVTFACSDALSGIATCPEPITISTEGMGQVVTGTVVDAAGNSASTSVTINLDKTPPSINSSLSSSPNASGWHKSDVIVSFICGDDISGITQCPYPVIVSTEGKNQLIAGTTSDKAGNGASTSVIVNLDKTPPILTMSILSSSYIYNASLTLEFGAIDTLSGLASQSATLNGISVNNGSTVILNKAGTNTFTLKATDQAGNTSTQTSAFEVQYAFSGFLPPIQADGSKVFKLGSTIPVKFQLKNSNGVYISTAKATLTLQQYSNETPIGDPIVVESTSGADTGNMFRYDFNNEQYVFNLNTKGLSQGLWKLQVHLDDGTTNTAFIQLK